MTASNYIQSANVAPESHDVSVGRLRSEDHELMPPSTSTRLMYPASTSSDAARALRIPLAHETMSRVSTGNLSWTIGRNAGLGIIPSVLLAANMKGMLTESGARMRPNSCSVRTSRCFHPLALRALASEGLTTVAIVHKDRRARCVRNDVAAAVKKAVDIAHFPRIRLHGANSPNL